MSSLEEADRKIDGLADSGQLNPALLLTMAKAYSAAKDTDMTKEEVKEIMGHLYFKASPSAIWHGVSTRRAVTAPVLQDLLAASHFDNSLYLILFHT